MTKNEHGEIGIREARRLLTSLVAGVEDGGKPVRLTKHGHHVASIVGAEDAERIESLAIDPLEVPGDVATATRIIEGLFPDGSELRPDYREIQAMNERAVAGGLVTILRSLFFVIRMKYPYGQISFSEEGESEPKLPISIAELIMQNVLREVIASALVTDESGEEVTGFDESQLDKSALGFVAGALWAAQVGVNPVEWRNAVKQPVSEGELMALISATYGAADFLRLMIDGGLSAEESSGEGLFWLREAIYEPESMFEGGEGSGISGPSHPSGSSRVGRVRRLPRSRLP